MNKIPETEPLEASAEAISTVSVISFATARIGVSGRGRAATNSMLRRHRPTMSKGAGSPGLGGREGGRREAGMGMEGISLRLAGEREEGKGSRSPRSAAAINGNEAESRRSIEIYVVELCGFPSYFYDYEYFFTLA